MSKKQEACIDNEAFVSAGPKVPLEGHESSLTETSLKDDEICTIFDFYVSHAPILKSGAEKEKQKKKNFGLRYLGEYGWAKNNELSKLERILLENSGMHNIIIKRSSTIEQTLHNMDLEGDICLSAPRSVIMQNIKITLEESGEVKVAQQESRMVCFFRHIRNSLAHNRMYYFEKFDMILLEDADEKEITARILIKAHTLFDWISVIDKEHKFYFKDKKKGLDKTA